MLLAGVAYFALARLGLLIPYVGTHVSLVWLPTGVALAAYWRWGPAMAPAIGLAAWAANLSLGGPSWVAAGIALGNTLGPGLSVWLLRRWRFDDTLVHRRDLGLYLAAVALGMVVPACNGTAWLAAAGMPAELWMPAWISWWIGDSVGALLGGVPLLALDRRALALAFLGRRGPGNLLLLGGVAASSLLTFSGLLAPGSALLLPLLALPFFLGALLALRSGALVTSLAALIVASAAAWGAARGAGPFARLDPQAGQLALWSYITAQACAGLLIWVVGAELLSSRRQFAALFEHATDGLIVLGPDDQLRAANAVACRLLKATEAQLSGLPLGALPHGQGAALAAALARWRADETGGAPLALGLPQPDGASKLPVEIQAASYRDAGRQVLTHLVLRDISARREAEARLQRSEHSLRAITDNMPVLICYLDREHRYRFANATYRDWFGVEPEALIGKRVDDLFPPALYDARRPYMDQAMQTGMRVNYEMEVELDGRHRHMRTTYVPDRAADGSVQGLYVLIQDITDAKDIEARLSRMARFDHLTGLLSRQPFEDRLDEAVRSLQRGAGALALLFIDIDHFKLINDNHGHAAGDVVLKEFARRLQQAVRSTDVVARLAGDEFVVLLERVRDPEQAQAVAAKVCAEMQPAFALGSNGDEAVAVTASVGVAWCEAAHPRSPAQMMAAADAALYDAKRSGRNTWRMRRCDEAFSAGGG